MAPAEYAAFLEKVANARSFAAGYKEYVEENIQHAFDLDQQGNLEGRDNVMREALNMTTYEDGLLKV